MNNQITDQYINTIYENLQREQFTLLNDVKTGCDADREKSVTKQLSLINTINVSLMKLRNLRNKNNSI